MKNPKILTSRSSKQIIGVINRNEYDSKMERKLNILIASINFPFLPRNTKSANTRSSKLKTNSNSNEASKLNLYNNFVSVLFTFDPHLQLAIFSSTILEDLVKGMLILRYLCFQSFSLGFDVLLGC